MTSEPLVIGGVVALVAIAAFVVWFVNYRGRQEGSANAQADFEKQQTEAGARAAGVVSEQRDPDDTSKRLHDRSF